MMRLNSSSNSKLMLPLIIGLVISLITSNVLLTAYALITLWYIYITLWKKGQPPILFAAFAMQWLQVSIKILQADLTSQAIEDVVIYPEDIQYAILLSLTSLIIIVTGLNTIIHKLKTNPPVYQTLIQYDIKKVVVVYIVAVILTYFLTKYSFVIGGLQQFIVKLVDFKWAIFFVFFLISDTKNRYNAFIIILIVEIALGLTGYFSNFKSFIFLTAITFIFSKQKLSLKEWGVATFLGFIVLNFMIVWQSVKGDYRNFLSGGERQQTVTVSSTEALDELGNLTSNIDYDSYNIGTESLIDRIAYVDFFSVTISNTNKNNLFEGGKLWYSAISNVLMPRFLFPDKAEIDDSEKTRKYAGVEVVGADQGTSISLGYVAETYVDFGPILMFLPLFGFGLLIGWIYKFIVTKSVNILWGFAFSTPLFFQLSAFEMALDKIVASIIAYFLVYLLLRKIFIRKLQAFITKN